MKAVIRIHSFKEGLLSGLGHDLQLNLGRFRITQSGRSIFARLEPASLVVEGALRQGKLDTSLVDEADREKIRHSLQTDVLRTNRFPEAQFTGRVFGDTAPYRVSGELTLCGTTQPLSIMLLRAGPSLRGEVELVPSQFGIKPFRALGGALKVQDRVLVLVEADAEYLADGIHEHVESSFAPE
jgi:hypothetical protein